MRLNLSARTIVQGNQRKRSLSATPIGRGGVLDDRAHEGRPRRAGRPEKALRGSRAYSTPALFDPLEGSFSLSRGAYRGCVCPRTSDVATRHSIWDSTSASNPSSIAGPGGPSVISTFDNRSG